MQSFYYQQNGNLFSIIVAIKSLLLCYFNKMMPNDTGLRNKLKMVIKRKWKCLDKSSGLKKRLLHCSEGRDVLMLRY